jgi:hypothetical protein
MFRTSRRSLVAFRSALGDRTDPSGSALEFLLNLVRAESLNAEAAIEAVLRSIPSDATLKHLESAVAGNPRLARVLAEHRRI